VGQVSDPVARLTLVHEAERQFRLPPGSRWKPPIGVAAPAARRPPVACPDPAGGGARCRRTHPFINQPCGRSPLWLGQHACPPHLAMEARRLASLVGRRPCYPARTPHVGGETSRLHPLASEGAAGEQTPYAASAGAAPEVSLTPRAAVSACSTWCARNPGKMDAGGLQTHRVCPICLPTGRAWRPRMLNRRGGITHMALPRRLASDSTGRGSYPANHSDGDRSLAAGCPDRVRNENHRAARLTAIHTAVNR
jgi:hypothetical protein